ncbi:MAG: PAS domain-containing protein [Gammaproteobacteria bacterium]|nr:PAS domain-containing protein [Gammaproteobacteria bacterium]
MKNSVFNPLDGHLTASFLDVLFDSVLMYDANGIVRKSNRAAHEMLDANSTNLEGRSITCIFASAAIRGRVEELDGNALFDDCSEFFTGTVNATCISTCGRLFPVECRAFRLLVDEARQFVIVLKDLTEHFYALETIKHIDRQYHGLLDRMHEAVVYFLADGEILATNAAFLEMAGLPRGTEFPGGVNLFDLLLNRSPGDNGQASFSLPQSIGRHPMKLQRSDGTALSVLVDCHQLSNQVVGEAEFEAIIRNVFDS